MQPRQRGLHEYPRNSHATCNSKLPINKHEEKNIRIPTGNAITFLHRLFGRPCPSSEAHFVFKTSDFEHPLPLKNAFGARNPSKTESSNCENEALAQGFLQKPPVEIMQTKLSRTTSFKNRQSKSCKQSCRARLPSKTASLSCKSETFVRDFFSVRLRYCEASLLWDFFAVRLLCCETSLLWDFVAVRLLCCEIRMTEVWNLNFLWWNFIDVSTHRI